MVPAAAERKSAAGLREHSLQGFNISNPHGYLADKIPHPNPAKRAEGFTKTRLTRDPSREWTRTGPKPD